MKQVWLDNVFCKTISSAIPRIYLGVISFYLSGVILGGCEDKTSSSTLSESGEEERGGEVSGSQAGEASLNGSQMGGIERGTDMGLEGEETQNCEVSCEEDRECSSLECECTDGQLTSFNGCVSGCCITASFVPTDLDQVCAELCSAMAPTGCEPEQTRCLDGMESSVERCSSDRTWQIESCSNDEICTLDTCLPATCIEGEATCASLSQIALCSGGVWTLGETCASRCSLGSCQGSECAQAEFNRSYLGCEYLALELPNNMTYEVHSATAVVINNPHYIEDAYVGIFNPEGQIANLISEQVISVPEVDSFSDLYTDKTIQSEVRDSAGQLVRDRVTLASQIRIPPGGTGTLLLPRNQWQPTGSMVTPSAYRIVSDRPVGAYQFAPYCCNFIISNDASLLIPTSALGRDYVYLGPPTFRTDNFEGRVYPATAAMIASQNDTIIQFTLPEAGILQVETEGRLTETDGVYTVTLNQQETLLLRLRDRVGREFEDVGPQPDLTGALISSNKPVAVFSGHECSNYPSTIPFCDHLEEQLFPTDAWGREFMLVPPKERGANAPDERIYWKVVSKNEGVRLTLSATLRELDAGPPGSPGILDCGRLLEDDEQTIVLNDRRYCEFSTKKAVALSANEGVMIMGTLSGQESVDFDATFGSYYGDPSIFLLPPIRQTRRDYDFLTPRTYFTDFAVVTFDEGTVILLDGELVDLSGATSIPSSSYQYIYLDLIDGAHKLEGNLPMGLVVFAYDDYVSYAYTGGLNLSKTASSTP